MKKVIWMSFLVLALSLPSIGMAASVGSPDTVGKLGGVSLSFEYDRVFNRDMKFKSVTVKDDTGTTSGILGPGESYTPEFDSNRFFLKATVGVHERVDLFLKLGRADVNTEGIYKDPSTTEKDEFAGDTGLAYGAGFKVKVLGEKEGLIVGVSGDYLRYKVDGKQKYDGVDFTTLSGLPYKAEATLDEWQIAVSAGYKMAKLTPYGGLKYSDVSLKQELSYTDAVNGNTTETLKTEADKNIGIFAGLDFDITKNLGINLEVRAVDETAGTIRVNYRF